MRNSWFILHHVYWGGALFSGVDSIEQAAKGCFGGTVRKGVSPLVSGMGGGGGGLEMSPRKFWETAPISSERQGPWPLYTCFKLLMLNMITNQFHYYVTVKMVGIQEASPTTGRWKHCIWGCQPLLFLLVSTFSWRVFLWSLMLSSL